jgi:hypothetical protein
LLPARFHQVNDATPTTSIEPLLKALRTVFLASV